MEKRPIHLLWIVNDEFVNNFITVYRECEKNSDFKMTVLAAPHLGYDFANSISSDEIYEYLTQNGVACINSWNKETGQYVEIEPLQPDYIFTTTPYDIYLPEPYRSDQLILHGQLCNVDYGAVIIKWEGAYSSLNGSDYYKNASMFFHCCDSEDYDDQKDKTIGYLKLDEYLFYNRPLFNPQKWKIPNATKIVWKPRWTMLEGDSTLNPYLANFYDFLLGNQSVELALLMHPLLEKNILTKGFEKFYQRNIEKLRSLPNFTEIDNGDFLDTALGADILIADHSSTIAEFTITGKPILYTTPGVKLNTLGKKIMEHAYVVSSFEEVAGILNRLIKGDDPKKEMREANMHGYFKTPPAGKTIAQLLLEILEQDFYSPYSHRNHARKVAQMTKREQKKSEQLIGENQRLIQTIQERENALTAVIAEKDQTVQSLNQQIDLLQNQLNALSAKLDSIPRFVKKMFSAE